MLLYLFFEPEWDRSVSGSFLLHDQVRAVSGTCTGGSVVHVIQDDLLHPILGGNKIRKLDGLLPALQREGVTDVVGPRTIAPWTIASSNAVRAEGINLSNGAMH